MKIRTLVGTAAVTGLLLAARAEMGHTATPASSAGGGHAAAVAASDGTVSSNMALGRQMAAARYGWTGQQWSCLDELWDGESGWSQYADTEQTGLTGPGQPFAYGIPQSYPSTKMPLAAQPASAGGSSNPRLQVRWGLAYVSQTYGSPCAALEFKQAHGNKGY